MAMAPNENEHTSREAEGAQVLVWPENDPQRSNNLFRKVTDGLFYPYMNTVLKRGAALHNERSLYNATNVNENDNANINQNENLRASQNENLEDGATMEMPMAMPKELSQQDLFQAPPHMRAEVLQQRFQTFHSKRSHQVRQRKILAQKHIRRKERNKRRRSDRRPNSNQSGGDDSDSDSDSDETYGKLSRKDKGWILIRTLWDVSQPTYTYAAVAQLVTVLVQTLYPLAVQQILILVETYPDESLVHKGPFRGAGLLLAFALFICSVVDGLAQERQKFLAFQSGITIRTATANAIYHHMLQLSSTGKQNLLMGETTNLLAIDCQKLFEVCQEGHLLWSCPLSMLIVMILLLVTLGPATLVGMTSMFLLVPVVKKVVEKMMTVRKQRAIHTDKRVDTTTAMLQAIRFCKLNHYEEKFIHRVQSARQKEMVWVKKELALVGLTLAVTVLTPVLASALTFVTYALMNDGKNVLTPSETFTTMLFFMALRFPINYAGKLMGKAAQGLEACERIGYFLDRDTVGAIGSGNDDGGSDDSSGDDGGGDSVCTSKQHNGGMEEEEKKDEDSENNEDTSDILLEVKNGNFTVGAYDEDDAGTTGNNVDMMMASNHSGHSGRSTTSTGKATFTVSGINISVKRGETLACVGPVGSGKSTLLHALVGDVSPGSTSDITMRGSVAYASQSPFILNATLRDNILFGLEYNQELYDRVLDACNLLPDLKQLGPSRDLTEIGERGVTLSGGQKARISLARCVYSQPSVALLDDILSALDASTGKYIFERLFESSSSSSSATTGTNKNDNGGEKNLLSNSAVVLVTHASYFLSRVDQILVLVKGKSVFVGDWDELLSTQAQDQGAREVISSICASVQENKDEESDELGQGSNKNATKSPLTAMGANDQKDGEHGVLMTEEERDFGLSDWSTWLTWFKFAGGLAFITVVVISLTIDRGFYVINEWWLASWTSAATHSIERFGITFAAQSEGLSAQYEFIKFYAIILVISFAGTVVRSLLIIQGGARSAEKLFDNMTTRVIRAPMSYFETTPMGRILNRLTYSSRKARLQPVFPRKKRESKKLQKTANNTQTATQCNQFKHHNRISLQ